MLGTEEQEETLQQRADRSAPYRLLINDAGRRNASHHLWDLGNDGDDNVTGRLIAEEKWKRGIRRMLPGTPEAPASLLSCSHPIIASSATIVKVLGMSWKSLRDLVATFFRTFSPRSCEASRATLRNSAHTVPACAALMLLGVCSTMKLFVSLMFLA